MAEGSDSGTAELIQWLILFVTAAGVGASHWWSRTALVKHRKVDDFDKHIGERSRILLSKIDAHVARIQVLVLGEQEIEIMQSHARLVRDVNTFSADCSNSPVSGGVQWHGVTSREIEDQFPTTVGEKFTALQKKTLVNNLNRLSDQIRDMVRENRPSL